MLSKIMKVSVALLAVAVLIQPKSALADWGRHDHYYRYHDHPHFGVHVSYMPHGYFTVRLGGLSYYYYDGLYYNRAGADYVIVNPPIGAIVTTIPPDYQAVSINGITYYTDSGTYYVYTRSGYQVVPAPANVIVQAPPQQVIVTQPAPVPAPVVVPDEDSITVNIPSDKGGYTAVTLKKSGAGFVGPQGEFYDTFPKVSRLRTIYGK